MQKIFSFFILTFVVVLVMPFTAFAQTKLAPANPAVPQVVVTFPALHALASMVMKGVDTPTLLLTPQQDAHHMHLRPSQMRAVTQADMFVYYDPGFEIFVSKLAAIANTHTKFLALSDVLDRQPHRESNHGWLNPDYAIAMLHYLSTELMRIDPGHAVNYEKNAEKYAAEIEDHATLWRDMLQRAQISPKRIVSDHSAFIGFTNYFMLKPTIPLEEPGGEISLKRLKEIEQIPVGCLIATHGTSAIMQRLADSKKVPLNGKLNPLGSRYLPGTKLYFQLMDDMVQEFHRCLTHP